MDYKGVLLYGDIAASSSLINKFENENYQIIDYAKYEIQQKIKSKVIPLFVLDISNIEIMESHTSFFNELMSFFFLPQSPESIYDANKFSMIEEKAKTESTYVLRNVSDDDTFKLINKLWLYQNSGGMLPKNIIELMIKCDMLLRNTDIKQISNSSYDLRLGEEYFYGGTISYLTDKKPFIKIEPYDYVIASCRETTNFPKDIAGRFDISVNLFCQGIILSNSTQVDPGFRGKLFCLLFNTSNKTIYIKKDSHYATLEFHKLLEPTTPYSGKYNDKENILHYLPSNVMQGAINELKREIEKMKKENKLMQNVLLGMISIFLALIAILLVL